MFQKIDKNTRGCLEHLTSINADSVFACKYNSSISDSTVFEPRYEKTGFLYLRKQRRSSAAQ